MYFSNQKHSHLMLFFSPAGKNVHIRVRVVLISEAGGSIVNLILSTHTHARAPSYGPMHLLRVCMNGSLSNWCTMLHYTPQWGSMQVR